jgi:hypothetical protein
MNSAAFSAIVHLAEDAVDAMQSAFDLAWSTLCASGQRLSAQQACDARIRLARTILECVQDGERDPRLLRDLALSALEDAPEMQATANIHHPYL